MQLRRAHAVEHRLPPRNAPPSAPSIVFGADLVAPEERHASPGF
jgi:hypothetical protein